MPIRKDIPAYNAAKTHFSYYDDWKGTILECPRCQWRGTFEQGSVEYHGQLMDSSCPACGAREKSILAIVSYPSMEDAEQNWSRLSDNEKREVIERKQFVDRWERMCLKTPNQLPELGGEKLKIVWGFLAEGTFHFTVLTHDDIELWREPALWEGYNRFRTVVSILERKYGERLADVVPTGAAETYLYGDILFKAAEDVTAIRKSLRQSHRRARLLHMSTRQKSTVPAYVKAHATGRWAEIIFRALSSRVARRWKFISFRGAAGGEWRGVVDLIAIRKDTRQPSGPVLKRGDLFDIILIQVKGGTARSPTDPDCVRLREVGRLYRARKIVQFQWRKGHSSRFFVLGRNLKWVLSTTQEIFE